MSLCASLVLWTSAERHGVGVRSLIAFYEAGELVGIAGFPQVTRALDAFLARPAVMRGVAIPKRQ